MRVQGVVEVPADSLAATTDTPVSTLIARRITWPLSYVIVGRIIRWPFRNPQETLALAPGAYVAVRFGSVSWGLAAASGAAFLVLAGQVAYAMFLGAGTNLRAILSAMSRRRDLARRWATVCYRVKLTAADENGSRYVPSLRRFRYAPAEISAAISTSALAQDASHLVKHAPGLAAGLGCDRVLFDIDTNRSGTVVFQWGRHLRREIRIPDVPATDSWERIPLGIGERGEVIHIPANKSVLAVAEAGAGKSTMAWGILAGYIRAVGADRIRVRVLDPKEIEFKALKDQIDSGSPGICHQYETSDSKADLEQFWSNLDRAMGARMESVRKAGVREHVPTVTEPLDITIVDETIPIAPELRKDGTGHTLGRVAFKGRAYGFVVIALSQAGQIDVLGRIRDLFPTRIAMKTGSQAMTDAVLGDGATSRGARCHELDELRDRGVGYISYGGRPKAFRAPMVTDADTRLLARGELPPSVREVAEAREYRTTWVYRHWGRLVGPDGAADEETLLYVGIANDLERREAQHVKDKPWMRGEADVDGNRWADVRVETREEDTFPRRSLAETQELLCIQRERPLYNDVGNRDNPLRVNWRARTVDRWRNVS